MTRFGKKSRPTRSSSALTRAVELPLDGMRQPPWRAGVERSVEKPNDQMDAIISYAMAKRSMDTMQRYVAAGRAYQSLEPDDLKAIFIVRFRNFVAGFNKAAHDLVDDLIAEYDLRKEQPPYGDLQAEMSQLDRRVKAGLAHATTDRIEEAAQQLVHQYRTALSQKQ